jgi:hypothetical protein
MTSRNFQSNMVDQNHEIIFEVVKVSGNWAFPAAKSIVEATKGKNMYLRLTDDGKSDIFRLDSVKDGENAGETVFGFVGNGGMDLVELTATTDGTGVTTGTWDYEPGEGPAGEAIGNTEIHDGGSKTEADLVEGVLAIASTNSVTKLTLTTAQTLTVLANEGIPNFALEIDNTGNSNDVTVTVKDSTGTTTLKASTAGGNTIDDGAYVQLTCVGGCWTMAVFS